MLSMNRYVYVGIDTSKPAFDVFARDEQSNILLPATTMPHSSEGYKELHKILGQMEKTSQAQALIGIESTGIYHQHLADYLVSKGYNVRIFNGLELIYLRKSIIRKTKTDKIDAELISRNLQLCIDKFKKSPVPMDLRDLRELCHVQRRLMQKIIVLKNQLIRDLDIVFPGYTSLFTNITCQKSIQLLQVACFPNEILNMSQEQLEGLLSPKQTKKLIEIAQRSMPVKGMEKSIRCEITFLCQQAQLLLSQVDTVMKEIKKENTHAQEMIMTITGIGEKTGTTIIAEIGNIENFSSPKGLVAFAGIDPVIKASGSTCIARGISKRGSKTLRTALFQAAVVAARSNPVIKQFYQKKRASGKTYRDAIICCARKLCHIIYSVLKNDKPFYVPQSILDNIEQSSS